MRDTASKFAMGNRAKKEQMKYILLYSARFYAILTVTEWMQSASFSL